jgi:hypothetical protein
VAVGDRVEQRLLGRSVPGIRVVVVLPAHELIGRRVLGSGCVDGSAAVSGLCLRELRFTRILRRLHRSSFFRPVVGTRPSGSLTLL